MTHGRIRVDTLRRGHHILIAAAVVAMGCVGPAASDGPSASAGKQDGDHWPERLSFVESRLYRRIVRSQIVSSKKEWFNGGWPVLVSVDHLSFVPGFRHVEETNLFVPLQIGESLRRVSQYRRLPDFDVISDRIEAMLARYVDDAAALGDPVGTVGYHPRLELEDGKQYRSFLHFDRPWSRLRAHAAGPGPQAFDLPSDLDTSSQAALWAMGRGGSAFDFEAFIHEAGKWRDHPNRLPREDELAWKAAGSGGFMTYAARPLREDPDTRIPGGENDVDCIVNLNVLDAVSSYRGAVPEETSSGAEAACDLARQALEERNIDRCGYNYSISDQLDIASGTGHFLLAWAKAYASGASCLESSRQLAKNAVLEELVSLAQMVPRAKPVTVAELIIAAKLILSRDEREEVGTAEAIETLVSYIERIGADYPAGPPAWTGILYVGKLYYADGDRILGLFYSEAQAAALILEALVTP